MRKRTRRSDLRFVAVPNETVDDNAALDFIAMSLLTTLLRHRDGWHIDLNGLGKRYGHGREVLRTAMGLLQVARYVVKARAQDPESGHWATEVLACYTPATDQDIETFLEDLAADGFRNASVIPPTRVAVDKAAARRQRVASHRVTGSRHPVPPGEEVQNRRSDPSDGFPASRQPVTHKEEDSKKTLPPPPQKTCRSAGAEPVAPAAPPSAEDEEEKTHAPPAGRPAAERHSGTDEVINAMGWPKGTEPRGDDLNKIRSEVSKVLRSGWAQERLIKHLIARMRWDKANDYTAVCLWVLSKCPEDPSQGRSALEEAIESLEAEIAARNAAVAACTGCDGKGWTEQGRHDHGRRGMDDELWELQNPEQAAINRSLNAKTSRAA